jgi:hypothetical protein
MLRWVQIYDDEIFLFFVPFPVKLLFCPEKMFQFFVLNFIFALSFRKVVRIGRRRYLWDEGLDVRYLWCEFDGIEETGTWWVFEVFDSYFWFPPKIVKITVVNFSNWKYNFFLLKMNKKWRLKKNWRVYRTRDFLVCFDNAWAWVWANWLVLKFCLSAFLR